MNKNINEDFINQQILIDEDRLLFFKNKGSEARINYYERSIARYKKALKKIKLSEIPCNI